MVVFTDVFTVLFHLGNSDLPSGCGFEFHDIEDRWGELWVTLCIAALFQRRDLVSIRCIASFQIMENTDMWTKLSMRQQYNRTAKCYI